MRGGASHGGGCKAEGYAQNGIEAQRDPQAEQEPLEVREAQVATITAQLALARHRSPQIRKELQVRRRHLEPWRDGEQASREAQAHAHASLCTTHTLAVESLENSRSKFSRMTATKRLIIMNWPSTTKVEK